MKINKYWEFPGDPLVSTWCCHCWVWVWCLIGELRSCQLSGVAEGGGREEKRKRKKNSQIKYLNVICLGQQGPVSPKGDQPWIFIGRTDAEAEAPILWPPDVKSWLIGKDPDVGKDWRQEKGMTEDEIVGWHHRLTGHEFEQALGDGEGQGGLVCCSPWGHKELDMT